MTQTTFSPNGHKRAVLYSRVSTDEQASNYSLGTQLKACKKYADDNGFVIVGNQYFDLQENKAVSSPNENTVIAYADDYSGATPIEARPEGRKAFMMLKSGEADCLVAYAMDRLARPPEDGDEWDTPVLIRGLAKLGKELHTVEDGQLKTDFASLFLAMFKAKQAGDERRKIIERSTRGRNAKASAGKVVGTGKPPYGYRFSYTETENGNTGRQRQVVVGLRVDDSEAETVKLIYKWYIEDLLSCHEITKRLTEMRVKTPGESGGYRRKRANGLWDKSVVHTVLRTDLYCGVWRYRKYDYTANGRRKRSESEVIEVAVPAIVSRATWELAQQRRKDNKKTSKRNHHFLLSGRIECGCGRNMTGCANGRGTLYYACGTIFHYTRAEKLCSERHVRQDVIEPLAWDMALQSKKSAAEFLAMLKECQEQQKQNTAPLAGQIAEIKDMIGRTSRQIKRLASLVGNATDDDEAEQYTADLEAAKAGKASQEQKLAKLEAEYNWTDALTDDDILAVLEMRGRDLEKLQAATFEEKRRYLAKIDLRVIVKDRKAKIQCKLPVPPKTVDLDSGIVVLGDGSRLTHDYTRYILLQATYDLDDPIVAGLFAKVTKSAEVIA